MLNLNKPSARVIQMAFSRWLSFDKLYTLNRVAPFARSIHTSGIMASGGLGEQFDEAKKKLNTLAEDPGNAAKLRLYGLYKQATTGKCNTQKPKMFDMVGKAKWDAWDSLGDISKEEAQKLYIEVVDELAGKSKAPVSAATTSGSYETLLLTKENGLATIVLNRASKKNAVNLKMYDELIMALNDAATDDSINITAMTGAGDFYSSGNDLSNSMEMGSGDIAVLAKKGRDLLNRYVNSFIDFPKPLIALVNGPAVGIAVTVLALFDTVYASEKATFHTPFSALGQAPEGCSSYLFPKIMGPVKANELLMFNRKLTAAEACERGLVAEVFPDATFRVETENRLREMAKLPQKSLLYAKEVNRRLEKDVLHKINDQECDNLMERWQSEDFMNAVASFFSRKSSL